jgi:hypothetical protein
MVERFSWFLEVYGGLVVCLRLRFLFRTEKARKPLMMKPSREGHVTFEKCKVFD